VSPAPPKLVETAPVHRSCDHTDPTQSPANSRRERYGIATIMSRGSQPAVAAGTTLSAENTQPRAAAAAADNSFDSVPTDYDVSDTTSRSRSGEPVTTTSMDSSSSATGARCLDRRTGIGSKSCDRKWFFVVGESLSSDRK